MTLDEPLFGLEDGGPSIGAGLTQRPPRSAPRPTDHARSGRLRSPPLVLKACPGKLQLAKSLDSK